jgi:hypothetical protein
MPINFPDTPQENAEFSVGSRTWVFINSRWELLSSAESLAGLSDVDLTGLGNEDLLTYDSGSGEWNPLTRAALAGDTAFSSLYASPDDVLALVIALGS